MQGIALYAGLFLLASLVSWGARALRIPSAPILLALGFLGGRGGFQLFPAKTLHSCLAGVELHLGVLLLVLGFRLGTGHLRLPPLQILRRTLPPLLLAGITLTVSLLALPALLPEPTGKRGLLDFYLPQAFVLAVYSLLAVRDLRGRPPRDVGSLFLVAIILVGAVHSFTPPLLWSPELDPGVLWRGPVLILGESGALGLIGALGYLLLSRELRLSRWIAGVLAAAATVALAWRYSLWLPFAGLGMGIALGRTHEKTPRFGERWKNLVFSEGPFLLLVALAFAPDLYFESVMKPSWVTAAWLAAVVGAVFLWIPNGRALVTGPGLLFLALTLTVRLDNRMSPITRSTVDLALPAWIVLRGSAALIRRVRERKSSPPRPSHTDANRTPQES